MATEMKNCDFCTNEKQSTTSVADMTPLFQSMLAKHFWFQESELLTFRMCSVCSLKVKDFHVFYSSVEKLHAERRPAEDVEGNLNGGDVVVKYEPLDSELDSGLNMYSEEGSSNAEQLIVGGLAFEIVDVSAKIEPFEEVNVVADEVKQEEKVEPELLVTRNNNETMTFDCLNCNKGFEDKKILELHMKIVHGDPSIVRNCSDCAKLEQLLREILVHSQAELSLSSCPVQCVVCEGRLQNMASLQRHLVWHWGETCDRCRKKPKNFNPETTTKAKETKVFICPYCKKDFGHINFLTLHVKNHHENAPPEGCQKCKALAKALDDLSEQDQSEDQSGRIKCGVCGGWLMSVASLKRHLAWHQSEPCETCRRGRSAVEAALKQHVNAQKMPKPKRYPTAGASQAKKSKSDLMSIRHICVYCGLSYDVYAELISHQVEEHPKQRHCQYTSITPN